MGAMAALKLVLFVVSRIVVVSAIGIGVGIWFFGGVPVVWSVGVVSFVSGFCGGVVYVVWWITSDMRKGESSDEQDR